MRYKKYHVYLKEEEKEYLKQIVKKGTGRARQIQRAHILLKADVSEGKGWTDQQIRETFHLARNTVSKIRKRFTEVGLEETVKRKSPERIYRTRLDGEQEAHLVALACSEAPEGYARWTLRLLAERMVALEYVDNLSYETVRQVLKKRTSTMA
jgi:transposase